MNQLEYAITQTMNRMEASALYHLQEAAKLPGHTVIERTGYPGGPMLLIVLDAHGKYVTSTKKPI